MRLATACGVVLMTGSLALAAPDNTGRLSRDLRDLASSGSASYRVDIIIQGEAAPAEMAGPVMSHGGSVRRRLELIRGLAATVPLSSLEDLAALPGVRHISVDRAVTSTQRPSSLSKAPSWPHSPNGWDGPNGRGVGVAVIDSGIFEHENLGLHLSAQRCDAGATLGNLPAASSTLKETSAKGVVSRLCLDIAFRKRCISGHRPDTTPAARGFCRGL